MSVPSNLIPTTITQLPEYTGSGTGGYMPYVIDGRTYKVLFSNIASVGAVPSSRVIAAGTGLTGGGSLAADRVIAIANGGVGFDQLAASGATAGTYGSGTTVPVLTVDVKGRVTAATTTPVVISGYVPEGRSVIAGTGLTGGGTLTSNVTLAVNFASSDPQALGTATAGVSTAAARGDHVHPAVNLSDTSQTQGALPLGRGGTGDALSPVAGAVVYSTGTRFALTALGLPGQVLVSNGTSAPSWLTVSGVGTVTSVDVSGGTTGLTFTGGPITSAGTITAGGTLGVANGGTGTGTPFTSGSLVFAGSAGVYSQNNANLFWDNVNSRLGVGTNAPVNRFQVSYTSTAPSLSSDAGSGASLVGTSTLRVNIGSDPSSPFGGWIQASNGSGSAFPLNLNPLGGNVGIGTAAPGYLLQVGSRISLGSDGVIQWGQALTGTNRGLLSWDTNTASVNAAANLVLASNGTTERMRITSAGDVGVGIASPTAKFHVSTGTSPNATQLLIGFSGTSANYYDANANIFRNGSFVESMRITSTGDVGIGTTTPLGKLDARGAMKIGSSGSGAFPAGTLLYLDDFVSGGTARNITWNLVTTNTDSAQISALREGASYATSLIFKTANSADAFSTERMRINSSGDLGIGIASPGSRLDVAGALMVNGTLSTGQTNKAAFQYGSNETSIRSYGATANSGFITFRTGGGGSDTERMRITPTGLVGIGATPSASRLEVNGSISNTVGSGGTLTLYETDATRANQLVTAADASGSYLNATFSTGGSAVLRLQTAGAERLRVKSTGQVRFVPLAAAPGSPEAGDVYYDSTTNKLRCYNGTTWNDLF